MTHHHIYNMHIIYSYYCTCCTWRCYELLLYDIVTRSYACFSEIEHVLRLEKWCDAHSCAHMCDVCVCFCSNKMHFVLLSHDLSSRWAWKKNVHNRKKERSEHGSDRSTKEIHIEDIGTSWTEISLKFTIMLKCASRLAIVGISFSSSLNR